MELLPLSAERSGLYSPLVLDYLNQDSNLLPFIQNWPDQQGYAEQIAHREFDTESRLRLHEALISQYEGLELGEVVSRNIDVLKDSNTFTVTTGQQIHIFLGPMYVYWKIVSAIAKADKLNRDYPDKHFVPVFWMATEDHDLEEVNHLEIFHKALKWDSNKEYSGPVGKLGTNGLPELLAELDEVYANQEKWNQFSELFGKAYSGSKNFAQATREVVHALFGQYGLVILDPDDAHLKLGFRDLVLDELKERESFKLVNRQTEQLQKEYKTQLNPREINLFYFDGTSRARIVLEEGTFKTADGLILCSQGEVEAFVAKELEAISANVVLRPVYQELILPNIAYIGGPGELAYWLQLKQVFDHYQVPYPILENRKSVFVLGHKLKSQLEKFQISPEELFMDETALSELVIERGGQEVLSLETQIKRLLELKDEVIGQAASILPQRAKPLADIFNNSEKMLKKVDKELFDKQKEGVEKGIEKVLKVRKSLFDKGFTQERNQYIPQYLMLLDIDNVLGSFMVESAADTVVSLLISER